MKSLPEAGEDGLVRATVAIKMRSDGGAELVEVNDEPVPSEAEEEKAPKDLTEPPAAPDTAEEDAYVGDMAKQLTNL